MLLCCFRLLTIMQCDQWSSACPCIGTLCSGWRLMVNPLEPFWKICFLTNNTHTDTEPASLVPSTSFTLPSGGLPDLPLNVMSGVFSPRCSDSSYWFFETLWWPLNLMIFVDSYFQKIYFYFLLNTKMCTGHWFRMLFAIWRENKTKEESVTEMFCPLQ